MELEEVINQTRAYYCLDCGKCTGNCPAAKLFPNHYNPRVILERLLTDKESDFSDDRLWLCAWCYKCYKRCPHGVVLPKTFSEIRKNSNTARKIEGFKKALEMIREVVPFTASFSCVCLHPERSGLDSKSVNKILDSLDTSFEKDEKKKSKKEVAIIGSGPAGITAAFYLLKKGYPTTV
ncbi:4Fe-4S dicluster domain-containing protein, partial [Candidatus Altiarchaeota archaeon]